VPGFPKVTILLLGTLIGGIGWAALRHDSRHDAPDLQPVPAMRGDAERVVPPLIQSGAQREAAPVQARLAPGLRHVLTAQGFGDALNAQRERLYDDIGLPFPGVRIRYDADLPEATYAIDAQDMPMAHGTLQRDAVLVAEGDGARWVPRDSLPRGVLPANALPPETVLARHIGEVIRVKADLFLGVQDVQRILDDAARNQPELVQEVVRTVPLQRTAEVMRRLVKEQISLRNTREILESLLLWVSREKDVVLLTEHVRNDLGAMTVARVAGGRDELPIIMLSQASETVMREAIQETMAGAFVALGPERSERLVAQAREFYEQAQAGDVEPVFACSMDLRIYLKRAIEAALPRVAVLSYQEIGNHIPVVALGSIEVDSPAQLGTSTA
jgi:type III secretion protein V